MERVLETAQEFQIHGVGEMKILIRRFAQNYMEKLFFRAGIAINGNKPWDIRILDSRFYESVLCGGTLALGETYMKGWWECDALDEFFFKLLQVEEVEENGFKRCAELISKTIKPLLCNKQSTKRAFEVGEHHYNAGNDLFQLMLDPSMAYSCGYWRDAENLTGAQEAKLDLICRKLRLEEGMKLLDIGCGWGSLALFAAKHYGAAVTGLTVSEEQAKFAMKRCKGLPVTIKIEDYRSHRGSYDAIASVGMFEHVGYKNYPTFSAPPGSC